MCVWAHVYTFIPRTPALREEWGAEWPTPTLQRARLLLAFPQAPVPRSQLTPNVHTGTNLNSWGTGVQTHQVREETPAQPDHR